MDNDRKKRLLELKDEQQRESLSQSAQSGGALSDATEGDDINKFLKEVVERKNARKQQLEIVHDFFENPAAYGVDTDIIPSSTTEDEIDARKVELQHKIDLLRSVLKALEGEMQLLAQVKVTDGSEPATEGEHGSSGQQTILEKKAAAKKKSAKKKAVKKKAAIKKSAVKKAAPKKSSAKKAAPKKPDKDKTK